MTRIVPDGEVGLGLQLPVQAQSRRFAEAWESEAGPEAILAAARAADEAGFLYVGVCDHLGVPDSHLEVMQPTWYDPMTTLAWVAAATSRVRLLTHVYVLALRHPLAAAKQFATLDRLSGGRLVVGVGAGHVAAEFDALGVPFDQRGAVLDDAIDALRALLDDEAPTITGRFPVEGLHLGPRPVQGHVPIWIGGSGAPALRRVAVRGDGWIPQGTPVQEMPDLLAAIRTHRAEAGTADSTSTPWPCPSSWANPAGTPAGGPPRAAPSRSPITCAPSSTSVSRTYRSAHAPAAWRSSSSRSTASAPRSPPCSDRTRVEHLSDWRVVGASPYPVGAGPTSSRTSGAARARSS